MRSLVLLSLALVALSCRTNAGQIGLTKLSYTEFRAVLTAKYGTPRPVTLITYAPSKSPVARWEGARVLQAKGVLPGYWIALGNKCGYVKELYNYNSVGKFIGRTHYHADHPWRIVRDYDADNRIFREQSAEVIGDHAHIRITYYLADGTVVSTTSWSCDRKGLDF